MRKLALLVSLSCTPLCFAQQSNQAPGAPGNAGSKPAPRIHVGPQIRVDLGGDVASNETSMSASPANPLEIVAGWNDYREGSARTGVGVSLDGGKTWSDFLLRAPLPHQSISEGDPMTCADPRTGTLWAGGITFVSNTAIFCARKDPGSATFEPTVLINTGGFIDKGWMAAGPGHIDPDNTTSVYVAYNFGIQGSTDLGDTWSSLVSLGSGLGYLPRVGPDGEVYVTYWDFATGVLFQRSFDGGQTFNAPQQIATRMDTWGLDGSRVPGTYRVAALNAMAVDPRSGRIYVVYPDTTSVEPNGANLDLYMLRSDDRGASWTTPVVINGDAAPLPGDQFFPWIEVDEKGRVHLVFYDTRSGPQDDDDPAGLIDAYYSYSDDGGDTWTEVCLSDVPFTSEDGVFTPQFIGDYLGLTSAGGRTFPLYMSTHQGGTQHVYTHVINEY